MEPENLRKLVAQGSVAIPCNINHKILSPEGTGTGMRTKINVNLGISGDCNNMINKIKRKYFISLKI